MTVFFFNVYPFQHIYVHHKNVGTSKDPITSPKNMNLYYYTLRVVYTAHKFTFQYSRAIFIGCMALNASYLGTLYLLACGEYADHGEAVGKVMFFVMIGVLGFFIL